MFDPKDHLFVPTHRPPFQPPELSDTKLHTPTIDGATITGATISGGSVTATDFAGLLGIAKGGTGTSSAPTYGKLLLGNAGGTYDLVATSSLGLSAGGAATWGAITGTCRSCDPQHTERYLAAFEYRFNRRFELDKMVERLARVAARTAPKPYRAIAAIRS